MSSHSEGLLSGLSELLEIYKESKKIVKFYETHQPDQKLPLGVINEFRNCLDHVMRAVASSDRLEHEINEAKEHAYRVFYDTNELYIMKTSDSISSIMAQYTPEVISEAYPNYYRVILPKMTEFRSEAAKNLVNKNIDPERNNKSLTEFSELFAEFYFLLTEVESNIPSLEGCKNRKKKFWRKEVLISFAIGLATGLISSIIVTVLMA